MSPVDIQSLQGRLGMLNVYVVWAILAKFGLYAANIKFYMQNDEGIRIYFLCICTILTPHHITYKHTEDNRNKL